MDIVLHRAASVNAGQAKNPAQKTAYSYASLLFRSVRPFQKADRERYLFSASLKCAFQGAKKRLFSMAENRRSWDHFILFVRTANCSLLFPKGLKHHKCKNTQRNTKADTHAYSGAAL